MAITVDILSSYNNEIPQLRAQDCMVVDLYFFGVICKVNRWSLGIDKLFQHKLYNGCKYLSMMGLELIHVDNRYPRVIVIDFF